MRAITTILTQLLCMVIWFRFTHQFLNPKENNWKREIKVYVLWMIWTVFTATIFWHDTEFKALITPFFFVSVFFLYLSARQKTLYYYHYLNLSRYLDFGNHQHSDFYHGISQTT